jgi:hypothetical protein
MGRWRNVRGGGRGLGCVVAGEFEVDVMRLESSFRRSSDLIAAPRHASLYTNH